MGNDGGSIPTRRELVKEAARDLSLTEAREKQKEHLAHRWSQCPITHKALVPPVVSDSSGDLYNKDGILQYLLAEEGSPERVAAEDTLQGRITSLKDVVEVIFEVEKDEKTGREKWVCPVTRKELGSGTKAVYVVPCGHVFSHEAVKEVKSSECVQCGISFVADRDVVPILPSTEADKAFVVERLERLRAVGLSHSLKRVKSEKKRKAKDIADNPAGTGNGKKVKKDNRMASEAGREPKNGAITNGKSTHAQKRSSTHEETQKSHRQYESDNIASLYAQKDQNGSKKNTDYMTRGYSITANARDR